MTNPDIKIPGGSYRWNVKNYCLTSPNVLKETSSSIPLQLLGVGAKQPLPGLRWNSLMKEVHEETARPFPLLRVSGAVQLVLERVTSMAYRSAGTLMRACQRASCGGLEKSALSSGQPPCHVEQCH
eukprot:4483710-Amphidinium_carterae.1